MNPIEQPYPTLSHEFLAGGGAMGEFIRNKDWSSTPIGPIDRWPQSLRTTVSLCLASNFPISLAWGPEFTQIYNDGYWPICGAKHPHAMGQDYRECWASAWPVIGDAFNKAVQGEASYLENQRMFLDRHGYLEETFFTFSFSPIRDESGNIGGLFHPVTEQTGKMLSERRTHALRDLAARTGKAKASLDVLILSGQVLGEYNLDLPFVLLYRLKGSEATLVSYSGIRAGTQISPESMNIHDPQSFWNFTPEHTVSEQVGGLRSKLADSSCGPYPESPDNAFVIPIISPGSSEPAAFLVAGVSPRLPLNDMYRGFYDLIASSITAALANAQSYEQERQRAEALAEIDRAKTTFFSNVSHEFRTPLTLMLGPIEDILDSSAPMEDEVREKLDVAYRNSLRLQKLVNSLLDFSRIEAGRIEASFEATDLAEYTKELSSTFRSAIEKVGLRLVVDCPPLPEEIFVDRDMWEKIVLNLLSNAFKHTFEGEISVNLHWEYDHASLIVKDSGIGVPPEQLPRLFERFHRVPNARSRTHEGSGIGLALVNELIKIHGGAITVDSVLDAGTTFRVTIPSGVAHLPKNRIRKSQKAGGISLRSRPFVQEALRWLPDTPNGRETRKRPQQSPSWNGVTHGGRARVLLADDNADMRKYVGHLLEPYCNVEMVADGEAALEAIRRNTPDLLLTDVMMPRLDGFQLLKAIRSEESFKRLPVILISARAGEESRIEGLQAGANDYLVKPFNARELLARVKSSLDLYNQQEQQAARALKESESRLRTLASSLERLVTERTKELYRSNEDLQQFAHVASHDLKEPVRKIKTFVGLVQMDKNSQLSKEVKVYLNKVESATNRMFAMINGVLTYSTASVSEHRKELINLNDVMANIMSDLEVLIQQKQATIIYHNLPPLEGLPTLIYQLFYNLINNSLKFSKTDVPPVITIDSLTVDIDKIQWAKIVLKDNGIGFEQKLADSIFHTFTRLHSKDKFEGTGLGLALCKKIVHRHHGTIEATGEKDQGAQFTVILPLKQPDEL